MTGARFGSLAEGVLAGGVPHHSFAVFCIYPYTGLLTDGRKAAARARRARPVPDPLGPGARGAGRPGRRRSSPLTWDGDVLALGAAAGRDRRAVGRRGRDGRRRGARRLGVPALGVGVRPAHRGAGGPAAPVHRAAPGDRQRPRRRARSVPCDARLSGQPASGQPCTSVQPVHAPTGCRGGPGSRMSTSPSGVSTRWSECGPRNQTARTRPSSGPPRRGPSGPDQQPAGPSGASMHRRRTGQPGGEQVDRLVVDLPRRAHLEQLPVAEQGHPVGEAERLLGVVGGVDGGRAAVALPGRPAPRGRRRGRGCRGGRSARRTGTATDAGPAPGPGRPAAARRRRARPAAGAARWSIRSSRSRSQRLGAGLRARPAPRRRTG